MVLKIAALICVVAATPAFASSDNYTNAALADKIGDLPGLNTEPDFNMFSGYLTVDEAQDTKYFYWFTECDGCDKATAPLALWTNGGPGCSGLLGFLTEQGPFRPDADGILAPNPYAWNKVANYLFIEQPVGVGFSYSTTAAAYKDVGDDEAAQLNYALILQFLERFPQFQPNDFYISAESYGGHYMPTLAKYIVDSGAIASGAINFRGFAVGNPYTDPVENAIGSIDTLYGHAMVPHPVYEKWRALCRNGKDPLSTACALLQAEMQFKDVGDINPYALDYPVCLGEETTKTTKKTTKKGKLSVQEARMASSLFASRLGSYEASLKAIGLPGDPSLSPDSDMDSDYEPCQSNYALAYLNQPDVVTAIHANPAVPWLECSGRTPYGTLQYNYTWSDVPMEPYYQYLLEGGSGLKILVFSGDDDSICGTVGTQSWIYDLGYAVKQGTSWSSWTDAEGQVAGYVEHFEGYSFATVHGAGHEVPAYKPQQALQLIGAFFNSSSWLM